MEKTFECAGPGLRLLAYVIDGVILRFFLWIADMCLEVVRQAEGSTQLLVWLYEDRLFHWSALDLAQALAVAGYFILTTAVMGGTPGKRALNLRVVSADGERLSVGTIVYRETVGRFLSSIFYLGYLPIFCTGERTALHDWFCDTRVAVPASARAASRTPVSVREVTARMEAPLEENQEIKPPGSGEQKSPVWDLRDANNLP